MSKKYEKYFVIVLAVLLTTLILVPARTPAWAMEDQPHLMVSVDVKPGSYPNAINISSPGKVPVALYGGMDFDVSQVDISTVKLHPMDRPDAGAPVLRYAYEDLNGDGYLDIIFKFKSTEIGLTSADSEVCLHGDLMDGTHFCGHDTVKVIG